MARSIWAGLGIACLFWLLYTALATWQQLEVLSDGQRLLNIAVIIALGWVGGQCMRRGSRP